MQEYQLFEAVANLVLQSVSVWEDLHLYAMTYSEEYNAFWRLLDERQKSSVCSRRRQNREERILPFSMCHLNYYRNILTLDNYERVKNLHWKKQLKCILGDTRFRTVLTSLNLELRTGHMNGFRYIEHRAAASQGNIRISTQVVCTNATVLYNAVR